MDLNEDFYMRLLKIRWFAACATIEDLGFSVTWVGNAEDAVRSLRSDLWTDVRTEAQGDLTGYLAKNHRNVYEGQWNKLAKRSRERLEGLLGTTIRSELVRLGVNGDVEKSVLLDLNRGALESAYRKSFPNVPVFFGTMVSVYERGHLPCGWDGELAAWPNGQLKVF